MLLHVPVFFHFFVRLYFYFCIKNLNAFNLMFFMNTYIDVIVLQIEIT